MFSSSADVDAATFGYDISGLTPGSEYVVRVTALTGDGNESSPAIDQATTPAALAIDVTAPSHCLTGEGRIVRIGGSTVGRTGVATIDVSYTVTGGREPYEITSPDTATTASTPAGSLSVSCARGIDLNNIAADANAVESGPKTIRMQVADGDGATAAAEVTVEIVENAYTTEYNSSLMRAGRSYVLGTSEEWRVIALPAGLDLRFGGLSEIGENGAAHFTDTVSGSEVVLDWGTGAEVYRNVVAPAGARGESSARDVGGLFDLLVASASRPLGVSYASAASAIEWRPYEGLHKDARVAVHPNMLTGTPIRVCNEATAEDFDDPHELGTLANFNEAFDSAVDAWNARLHVSGDDSRGTPHRVFEPVSNCAINSFDISVYRDADGSRCGIGSAGCAHTKKHGRMPPMIGGGKESYYSIGVTTGNADFFEANLLHELGHFLGLGDYKDALEAGHCPDDSKKSVMTSKGGECHSSSLTVRDLDDVHAVYHPDALGSAVLVEDDRWAIRGLMPRDTNGRLEFNAYRLVVWSRPLGTGGAYSQERSYSMDSDAVSNGFVNIEFAAGFDATGKEFLVAGVTRGDWRRRTVDGGGLPVKWVAHSEVTSSEVANSPWAMSRSWTLGGTVTLAGPPTVPQNVRATAHGAAVDVSWDAVGGATTYRVLWHTSTFSDPADASGSVRVPGDRDSWTVRDLALGQTHYFGVEASSGVFDGGLSAPVTATPTLPVPDGLDARFVKQRSFLARWAGVLGADGYWVRLDGGTARDVANTTAYTFEGLQPDTDYTFAVQAAKGTASSSGHCTVRAA